MEIEIDVKPTILVIHKQSKASSDKSPSLDIASDVASLDNNLSVIDVETGNFPPQLKKISSPPAPIPMVMEDEIEPERPLTDFLSSVMEFIAYGWGNLCCETPCKYYLTN